MSAHMTPAQAAQKAGTSRWTIMRAINAQQLRATRDNRNQWRITSEDLAAWQGAHPAHSAHTVQEADAAQAAQPAAHLDKALQDEVESLRRDLAVVRDQLGRERALADDLRGLLAQEQQDRAQERETMRETIADLRKSRDRAEERVLALATPAAAERLQERPSGVLTGLETSRSQRGFLSRFWGR
jgi:excisionase family DNA binding protein